MTSKEERRKRLFKLFKRNPASLGEMQEFASTLEAIYQQEGDFLPQESNGWVKAREIGQAVWNKYGEDGMQFVISGVYLNAGPSASDSLSLAWRGIGSWIP